jgi:hypothetical protein
MTVLASSILVRVRTQLVDNGSTLRWADTELLSWLSDGQRSIVAVVPWASPKLVTLSLVAGTRQTIPSDGFKLINVYRNLTAGGTAGLSCLYVPRNLLDTQYPSWHTSTAQSAVTHWTYDENDPAGFYVYPRNDGTGSLEINYSYMPVDLTATTTPLTVRDIYQTALFDYVMFRAHSKDSDYAAGQQLAGSYWQSFQNGLAPHVAKGG